jgi:DNA-binding LacI/PurR family transcriptional regulator
VKITSTDVARRAGVSRTTVSYVLNNAPNQAISDKTREAVLQAARDLGYRPHPLAQSLKRGRSAIVLLPLPGLTMTHVVARVVEACADALAGWDLTLVTDFSSYSGVDAMLEAWLRLYPAAVINLALRPDDPLINGLREAGVQLLSTTEKNGAGLVAADALALKAREAQIAYLLERGRRSILVAGPGAPDRQVERRLERTLRRTVDAAGGTLAIQMASLSRAGVEQTVATCRGAAAPPEAICAYNDDFAIALLSALAAAGVGVPDDVAVIGVDDVPLGALVTPSLTTVTADYNRFGEAIAEATKAAIEGEGRPDGLSLPEVRVVPRESA